MTRCESRASIIGKAISATLPNPLHLQTVKAEIAKHPQSVKTVVAKLEEELDLAMHPDTLKRFLKKMVTVSAASVRASNQGRWQQKEPRRSNC